MTLNDRAAIVGIGETDYTRGTRRSSAELMLEATRIAINDAGLLPSQIDGVIPPPVLMTGEELAANLGIGDLRYCATVNMGGASPTAAIKSAAMAVAQGIANHVLVVVGWHGYSALRPKPGMRGESMSVAAMQRAMAGYYVPYGVTAPVQMYA